MIRHCSFAKLSLSSTLDSILKKRRCDGRHMFLLIPRVLGSDRRAPERGALVILVSAATLPSRPDSRPTWLASDSNFASAPSVRIWSVLFPHQESPSSELYIKPQSPDGATIETLMSKIWSLSHTPRPLDLCLLKLSRISSAWARTAVEGQRSMQSCGRRLYSDSCLL